MIHFLVMVILIQYFIDQMPPSNATLLAPHDVDNDEEDPFGDLEDEDEEELEGNKVVIDLDC